MKKILILSVLILFIVLFSAPVKAEPAKSITIDNNTLLLNGSGHRSKFFIKVYRGSLYLSENVFTDSQSIGSEDVIFENGYPGAVKMEFVYSEVEAEKIRNAFMEGVENNFPAFTDTEYVKKFINTFDFNVVEGDIITLFVKDKDSVIIFFNENILNTINGKNVGTAVYKIYLGEEPADGSLKSDMLGG